MNPTPSLRQRIPQLLIAFLAAVVVGQPAQAHGIAQGGLAAGLLHPLAGTDHLLLLIAVGAAAAALSPQLLLWALGGAIAGGAFGAVGGGLPGAEVLAALAIPAVALLVLRRQHSSSAPAPALCGGLVAAAVAVHAMLHGQEAPATAASTLWWLGVFSGSAVVSGGSFLALRRLPSRWSGWVAMVLVVFGGLMVAGPLGLLPR